MRDAVIRLKFNGMKENAAKMISIMKQAVFMPKFIDVVKGMDFLVPVPLHARRQYKRGFNQAALLAAEISKEYGTPVLDNLRRVIDTKYMYGLSRTERFENIKGAFIAARPDMIACKNIMIVDDIYTTGATLEECARTLKLHGADNVCAFTFCVAADERGGIDI
jgi:ComF family protein